MIKNNFKVLLIIPITLMFALVISCKKNNEEINYQPWIHPAQNLLYAKHNLSHLAITYFKAITNESLDHNQGTGIDGGWVSREGSENEFSYTFKFIVNDTAVFDGFKRFRYGVVNAKCDKNPLTISSNTHFEFDNFGFNNKPIPKPETKFNTGSFEIKLLSIVGNIYLFEQRVSSLEMVTQSKSITIDGTILYEWVKANESSWFVPEKEDIRIKEANLILVNDDNALVELILNESAHYAPLTDSCGILKGGKGEFQYLNLIPSEAIYWYDDFDTVCNIGAKMEMTGLPFRPTIDKWIMY